MPFVKIGLPPGRPEPMIILELGPAPARPLSLNEERRLHWRDRRDRTRPWHDLTILMARQARLAQAVAGVPATITVVIPVRDDRRRDPANFYPVVKACIDGLVKAGVWPDDDPRYVRVNEPILTRDPNALIRLELVDAHQGSFDDPTSRPARVDDIPTGGAL